MVYNCKKCGIQLYNRSFVYDGLYGNYFCCRKCYDKYYYERKNWFYFDFWKEASCLPPYKKTVEKETSRFEIM